MYTAKDLLEQLNTVDECTTIEAKKGSAIDKSILETICAYSNEPGLGGGYILLGIVKDESSLFPYYKALGINDPDKLQLDLSSQCASSFNQPVRPEIEIEKVGDGRLVMKIYVNELPDGQKPLYFKNAGLPKGAFRRIGSSDQTCTDDDLFVFYNKEDSRDSSIVRDTSINDISEEALTLYRNLRQKVSPLAEELNYNDEELLLSLGCLKKEKGELFLTYAGLLVFGKRQALRRLLPMVRVDFIRVPGNVWVQDPENRFTTIDMRGPLIELVQRTFSAIADDLPNGFLLQEGQVQAENIGLPSRVLREAIVNAFMHRTYRENQPIQIIRYGNRIEIKNPGFSLKPEDELGEPGSKNRNPFIAAIFHETNLAETKGSGIRTIRNLMDKASMVPPTFESDHGANQFTTRLLLHHFLSEEDINALQRLSDYDLNDQQKRGVIFLRETGAIDNSSYRQVNGCDVLKASVELRAMRESNLLVQKGKGRYTYYEATKLLLDLVKPSNVITTKNILKGKGSVEYLEKENQPDGFHSIPDEFNNLPDEFDGLSDEINNISDQYNALPDQLKALPDRLPQELKERIKQIGKRHSDKNEVMDVIVELCKWQPLKLTQIAQILRRNDKYLLETYITPLKNSSRIAYTIPEQPNHPDQGYTA